MVDVNRILSELREERANLIDAIANLERLARGRGKRRGPPSEVAGGSSRTEEARAGQTSQAARRRMTSRDE